jgi:CRISPR-associated endonuclease/helicase Cas3
MSFSFKLKSHPDKTLYEHLKGVGLKSKKIVEEKQIENREMYARLAYLIGISHDFGKATTYFQQHLTESTRTENAVHSKLSSVFGYYLCKKNPEFGAEWGFIAWLVIIKHHTDISDIRGTDGELEKLKDLHVEKNQIMDIRKNSLQELDAIYKELFQSIDIGEFFDSFDCLCQEIQEEGVHITRKNTLDAYFLILFFYSVLLDADKLDASGIDSGKLDREREKWSNIPPETADDYKKIVFKEDLNSDVNRSREESYQEVVGRADEIDLEKERIMSIELPTGCGKTLAAFSFSLKLRKRIKEEMGFVPRIIYSLPFLSIIDQNAEVLSEVLAEYSGVTKWDKLVSMNEETKRETLEKIPTSLFLKHHHLSDVQYKMTDDEFKTDQSLLLIEGWHSEIVITTFIQFFHSLITNRNRAARKFHNITNSIIILDEVQSVPHQFWLLIKTALKYLVYRYNCWIIFMTATMPLLFDPENYPKELRPLIENKEKYFKRFNRLVYDLDAEKKSMSIDDLIETIPNKIFGRDTAIIVNTIEASKKIYNLLKEKMSSKQGKPKITDVGIAEFSNNLLINLSTNILPEHRKKRIEKIKNEKNKRKLIVTTQLIEAGVDIDVDLVFRDLAPFDSIIQSGGRCNRNGLKKDCCLKIINLKSERDKKFSSMVYDSTLLDITSEIIERPFREMDVDQLTKNYFDKAKSRSSDDESQEKIRDLKGLKFYEIGKFSLIEENIPKVDIFVEINALAEGIWKEYKDIDDIQDKFERRNKFLAMRNIFYNYVISVDEKKARRILNRDQGIGHVSKEDLEKCYDLETGFKGDSGAWII